MNTVEVYSAQIQATNRNFCHRPLASAVCPARTKHTLLLQFLLRNGVHAHSTAKINNRGSTNTTTEKKGQVRFFFVSPVTVGEERWDKDEARRLCWRLQAYAFHTFFLPTPHTK